MPDKKDKKDEKSKKTKKEEKALTPSNSEKPMDEEVLDGIIDDIPAPAIKQIRHFMSEQMSMSVSNEPPGLTRLMGAVSEKMTSEHLTQLFSNSDKSDKRGFIHSLVCYIGGGALFVLMVAAGIFVLNMFKDDKEMVREIFKNSALLLGGLGGGFGGGYIMANRKNK